jgi:hypothetical protein
MCPKDSATHMEAQSKARGPAVIRISTTLRVVLGSR